MRTLHLTGLALAIATGFALPLAGSAEAAMSGALPSTQVLPVENAQFFFLGHNFCWYDDGWQGPGWYWCDYAWSDGYGWGGGEAGMAGAAVSGIRPACRGAARAYRPFADGPRPYAPVPCAPQQCRPNAAIPRRGRFSRRRPWPGAESWRRRRRVRTEEQVIRR